jgi:Fe-S-cluster containining protein
LTKAYIQGGLDKVGELIHLKSYPVVEQVVNEKIIEASALQGRKITCTKGCDSCCHEQVLAQGLEGVAAVAWINKQPKSLRKQILKRLDKWYKEITRANINLNLNKQETVYAEATKYWAAKIACPFLDNGICSIYPVRPFACRTMLVTSDPEECKKTKVNAVKVQSDQFEQIVRSEILGATRHLNTVINDKNQQEIINMVSWFPYITKILVN